MAGRKIREALRQEIRKHVDFDPFIVIAGLSNIYTHYITTVEEYNAQRYEAGSVIYGENTLQGKEIINFIKKNVFNQLTRKRQSAWQEKCFLVRLVVIRQILLRSQLLIFSSVLKGLA